MSTEAQARAALTKFRALDQVPWGQSISVWEDGTGAFGLVVYTNTLTEKLKARIPKLIDGVPVRIKLVRELKPAAHPVAVSLQDVADEHTHEQDGPAQGDGGAQSQDPGQL